MSHQRTGQCEYTHGDRMCPAPASRRAGGRWRCVHHADWWEACRGSDKAQGLAILEDAERAYAALRAGGGKAMPEPKTTVGASGQAALAAARAVLDGVPLAVAAPELETDAERFARIRDWAVHVYRLTRAALEAEGVSAQEAHVQAIGVAAVQAIAWGMR